MKIDISDEVAQFVIRQLDAGSYRDASELVAAALQQMMQQQWTPESLRAAVAVGMNQADKSQFAGQSIDEIFSQWERAYSAAH